MALPPPTEDMCAVNPGRRKQPASGTGQASATRNPTQHRTNKTWHSSAATYHNTDPPLLPSRRVLKGPNHNPPSFMTLTCGLRRRTKAHGGPHPAKLAALHATLQAGCTAYHEQLGQKHACHNPTCGSLAKHPHAHMPTPLACAGGRPASWWSHRQQPRHTSDATWPCGRSTMLSLEYLQH